MTGRRAGNAFWMLPLAAVLLAGVFFCWQNNALTITDLRVVEPGIPQAFDGFQILHLSDLHGKRFGPDQDRIVRKILSTAPDAIVVTGDLIDSRKKGMDDALALMEAAAGLAPVYFVPGNHEAWSGEYPVLKEALVRAGVIVLDNQSVTVEKQGDFIVMAGLMDPEFGEEAFDAGLKSMEGLEGFVILLSHRAERMDAYSGAGMNLVFAGHAHGGQVVLPFLGGLVAPDQGIFPKYHAGLYRRGDTAMVVSRGLGNSIFPLRIFNPPEMVLVVLESAYGR
ncbi:MAG: metallophosphoesterase [Clostridia bacterium]